MIPFYLLDNVMINHNFPPPVRIVAWALLTGGGSMLLFGLLAPQHRIRDTRLRMAEAGQWVSFRYLALVLVPGLLAALPAGLLIDWLADRYGNTKETFLNFGPLWLRSWHAFFWPVLISSAVFVKKVLRIEPNSLVDPDL